MNMRPLKKHICVKPCMREQKPVVVVYVTARHLKGILRWLCSAEACFAVLLPAVLI